MARRGLAGARPAAASPAAASAVVVAGRPLSRFYLRFHIALILLWSFCAGVLASKALLLVGVHAMLWRYPVALLVSYAAFFAGIRVWLAYVGADPFGDEPNRFTSRSGSSQGGSSFDIGSWGGSGSGPTFKGGGGEFSGGGASGSFGADAGPAANVSTDSSLGTVSGGTSRAGSWFSFGSGNGGSTSSGKGGGGLDLDLGDGDGWLIVLLLILVAALLTSVFGAVIYVLHAAPAMLSDVAFQAMLAGGLVKSSQRWRDACWETSLFRATWIPFAIIFILAVVTAALAGHLFPGTRTLHEVIQAAWSSLG